MDATYDYNKLISSRILDNYDKMLGLADPNVGLPQPTMFGGKRMRNYVLPGSTDYDYPGSLSVGTMGGPPPSTLAGAFWGDFADGFPTGLAPQGGASCGGVSGGVKAPEYHTLPYYPPVKGRKPRLDGRRYAVPAVMPEGGSKKTTRAFVKGLKKVGKFLAPVAKDVGKMLLKEGVKKGIEYYTKAPASAPAGKGRVGKAVKGLVRKGKKAVKGAVAEYRPQAEEMIEEMKGKVKAKAMEKGKELVGKAKAKGKEVLSRAESKFDEMMDGGVLIRNDPSQFHSSVYPPALASYTAGRDAYGRGRAKLPKSGAKRNSARGAIVAEVMKKQGLSLAQASKYVKEHGLY